MEARKQMGLGGPEFPPEGRGKGSGVVCWERIFFSFFRLKKNLVQNAVPPPAAASLGRGWRLCGAGGFKSGSLVFLLRAVDVPRGAFLATAGFPVHWGCGEVHLCLGVVWGCSGWSLVPGQLWRA